jgi:hypothetical protein
LPQIGLTRKTFGRRLGDPTVNQVDHAADGASAKAQSSGPPQDLDAVDEQGLGRNSMVG